MYMFRRNVWQIGVRSGARDMLEHLRFNLHVPPPISVARVSVGVNKHGSGVSRFDLTRSSSIIIYVECQETVLISTSISVKMVVYPCVPF
jgi:hypothetical protein